MLEEELGIGRLKAVAGISMGGMQAFEWGVSYPGFAEKIIHDVSAPFGGDMDQAAERTQADFFVVVGLTDHVVTPGPCSGVCGTPGRSHS